MMITLSLWALSMSMLSSPEGLFCETHGKGRFQPHWKAIAAADAVFIGELVNYAVVNPKLQSWKSAYYENIQRRSRLKRSLAFLEETYRKMIESEKQAGRSTERLLRQLADRKKVRIDQDAKIMSEVEATEKRQRELLGFPWSYGQYRVHRSLKGKLTGMQNVISGHGFASSPMNKAGVHVVVVNFADPGKFQRRPKFPQSVNSILKERTTINAVVSPPCGLDQIFPLGSDEANKIIGMFSDK